MTAHLIARNLRQTYHLGDTSLEVLRGIDLTVAKGEILFLRGASGAGKTATDVMGVQAQQKGATMGLLGGLAGAGGSMGSSAIANK